ncbi:MAG: adenosylcobinamide-phosphate synthase CbiB [Eggerthellaceae bacterium]
MLETLAQAIACPLLHGPWIVAAIAVGLLLDALLGDPLRLPHPVVGMGKTISWAEKRARKRCGNDPARLRNAGRVLAFALPTATFVAAWAVLICAAFVSPILAFALQCLMCYQVIARRELSRQSMLVAKALTEEGLEAGRKMVARIVGRDVDSLDETGVTKAAVETVAENANDGVIAPLFFLAIGGGPLALAYKAVSTLDSMVGYKNERYLDFGRASAKSDDVLAFIPARVSALCMVVSAALLHLDAKGAWRIWRRDHSKHASPNSAHTEAATAGALGVQLAGNAVYGGVVHEKPTIGDATRPVELADIARAGRLMTLASLVAFCLFAAMRLTLWALTG